MYCSRLSKKRWKHLHFLGTSSVRMDIIICKNTVCLALLNVFSWTFAASRFCILCYIICIPELSTGVWSWTHTPTHAHAHAHTQALSCHEDNGPCTWKLHAAKSDCKINVCEFHAFQFHPWDFCMSKNTAGWSVCKFELTILITWGQKACSYIIKLNISIINKYSR